MRKELYQLYELMRKFDCTPRETKIYLHALSVGPASVQEYAHDLRENRVTVYSAIEKLIQQGFMYESRKGKRRLVAASDPKVLERLLQKKRNELTLLEPSIIAARQWLETIQKTDQSTPSVKFYEGVDGFKFMLEETLESKTEVLVFTYVDLFAKLLTPKYLENYYARRAKLGIHTRLIFPKGAFGERISSEAQKLNMEIRFLAPELHWKSGFFCWNNTLAIQSFTEGKVACTVIENEDIASFYRKIVFELCWKQAM